MTIRVVCPNGHKIKAKDSLAGRRVSCPKCSAKFAIPPGETSLEPLDIGLDPFQESDGPGTHSSPLDDLFAGGSLEPVVPTAPANVGEETKSQSSDHDKAGKGTSSRLFAALIIGGSIAGVIFLASLSAAILAFRTGNAASNERIASANGQPDRQVGSERNQDGGRLSKPQTLALTERPFYSPFQASDGNVKSIMVSELSPEAPWALNTDEFEVLAARAIDLGYYPKAWRADAAGRYLALLGERRISILSVPGLKIEREIGFSETPEGMDIDGKHLALIHADGTTIELVDWQRGDSLGMRVLAEPKPSLESIYFQSGKLVVACQQQYPMSVLSVPDLEVPELVGQIAAHYRRNPIVAEEHSWLVGGVRLNESMDRIICLSKYPLVNLVEVTSLDAYTRSGSSEYLNYVYGSQFNRMFTHLTSTTWLSPGGEYILTDPAGGKNTSSITYYLDYNRTGSPRPLGFSTDLEKLDSHLALLRTNMTRKDRKEIRATVLGGHLILEISPPGDLAPDSDKGLFYVDLRETAIPPRNSFDANNPAMGVEVTESPIELMPGATATVRYRVPETWTVESAEVDPPYYRDFDCFEVVIERDVVRLQIDNEKLIDGLLNVANSRLTFRGFKEFKLDDDARLAHKPGNTPRQIREKKDSPAELVAAYVEKAVNSYECITGYEAVGIPVLVGIGLKLNVRRGTDRAPVPIVQKHRMFWQPTEEQARWMATDFSYR